MDSDKTRAPARAVRHSPKRAAPLSAWRSAPILILFVSGAIEGFVTPSGLPTWARISIGIAAELAFLTYVYVLGGRAVRQASRNTGDVDKSERSATTPTAA